MHEVSDVYTSSFLDTDDLKMALRARKVSGAFEKQAPGPVINFLYFLDNKPLFSRHLHLMAVDTEINFIWLISIVKNL